MYAAHACTEKLDCCKSNLNSYEKATKAQHGYNVESPLVCKTRFRASGRLLFECGTDVMPSPNHNDSRIIPGSTTFSIKYVQITGYLALGASHPYANSFCENYVLHLLHHLSIPQFADRQRFRGTA